MSKENNQVMVQIPDIVKDCVLPEPENLNFYKLYEKRSIYVTGEIDTWLIEISRIIHIINIEDKGKPIEEREPIKIFIYTEGGDMLSTWNFIDVVNASKTPVWTINFGLSMSAGMLMLVSGHKRFALRHSTGLYHSGSAELGGTREQVESMQKWYDSLGKTTDKWFLDHCKIDQKLFNRKKKTDWYMTAEEMLEYGIVDKIIDSLDEVI